MDNFAGMIEASNKIVKGIFKKFLKKQMELGVIDVMQYQELCDEIDNKTLAQLGGM